MGFDMNHFRGHFGYALLAMFLSLGLCGIALVVTGIISKANVPGTEKLTPFLIVTMLFTASFLSAGQFVKTENRSPKLRDTNIIATQTVSALITLFVTIYAVAALILLAESGDGSKLMSKSALSGAGSGILGFSLLCYLMVFINFQIFARFRVKRA